MLSRNRAELHRATGFAGKPKSCRPRGLAGKLTAKFWSAAPIRVSHKSVFLQEKEEILV